MLPLKRGDDEVRIVIAQETEEEKRIEIMKKLNIFRAEIEEAVKRDFDVSFFFPCFFGGGEEAKSCMLDLSVQSTLCCIGYSHKYFGNRHLVFQNICVDFKLEKVLSLVLIWIGLTSFFFSCFFFLLLAEPQRSGGEAEEED